MCELFNKQLPNLQDTGRDGHVVVGGGGGGGGPRSVRSMDLGCNEKPLKGFEQNDVIPPISLHDHWTHCEGRLRGNRGRERRPGQCHHTHEEQGWLGAKGKWPKL